MAIKFLDEEEQPRVSKIKFLDEEEPSVVSPARPTPQQIERQQGAALTPPEGFVPNRSVMPAYEGKGGAAFGVYRVQGKARQENIKAREAAEPKKMSVEDVAADEELFNKAQAYMKASGGDAFKKGEDKAEYVNKFLDHRTFIESSLTFGAAPELSRLVGGSDEVKKAIAEGRDLYENMADREGLRPAVAVTKGLASDIPLMAITGGTGKVAGGATAKLVSKEATKELMDKSGRAGIAIGEAMLGGAGDITQQRIEQQTAEVFGEEPADLNLVRTGAVMLFSGSLGYVAGGSKMSQSKAYDQGKALEKALLDKNLVPATPTSPQTPLEKALVDPMVEQMDRISETYKKETGKDLIDAIDPVNELTDAKVRNDMSAAATRLALKVMEIDPTFQMKPNEKISAAINNVFSSLDKIDDVTLERALSAAGVNAREFAMMNSASISDAARQMQGLSVAARLAKTLGKNAAFEKKIRDLYDFEDLGTGALAWLHRAQQSVAREWKAWITSGVDTTSRNTLSTATVLTMQSGVQFMEGVAFSVGNALSNSAKGNRVNTLYKGLGQTVKDSFDVYFYMREGGLSSDIVETLLSDSPSLRNNIVQSLQETGNKEITAVGQFANSLNVTVDAFIRRAVFSASVDRQLRRQGMDLYKDFLAVNKSVPTDILKTATKEALQTTFSYLPKAADSKLVASSVERAGGAAAANVISFIDKTPFLNFAIPFPRYMANAMAYTYRYSPLGNISAAEEMTIAFRLSKEGKQEQATMLYRQASEKLIKAQIGTASVAAAIAYRESNKEDPWYEVKTNQDTTIDIRALGPQAGYFAFAEVISRMKDGTYKGSDVKAAMESITGFKFKAGSQDTFLDSLVTMYDSEEKFKTAMAQMGKFVGNIAGGFTQPFVTKQFFDFIDLIRDEGTVARDAGVIESEGAGGAFLESAGKQVVRKLPVLKETLPESSARLKAEEQELTREGEFFNRLLGFRQTIQRTPEEKEINKLNLDPFKLYGSSTGDKVYDKRFIETANPMVLERVKLVMNNPQYQNLPEIEKNLLMTNQIREATSEARKLTNAYYEDTDLQRVYKMRWKKIGPIKKRAILRRYAEDNNGASLEENKDYFSIDKYETELEGRTNFSRGGFVSEMARMLAKGPSVAEQTEAGLVSRRG
jgi:hypothetical protein